MGCSRPALLDGCSLYVEGDSRSCLRLAVQHPFTDDIDAITPTAPAQAGLEDYAILCPSQDLSTYSERYVHLLN